MDDAPDIAMWKRRTAELEAVCGLAAELLRVTEYDELLDVLVKRSLALLHGERGFLVLRRGEDEAGLDYRVVRNWSRSELLSETEVVSKSIVAEVLRSGAPLLVHDAALDARFESAPSVQSNAIRSVLAAPLLAEGRPVGALYIESRDAERFFDEPELGLFSRILELGSPALQAATRRLLLEQEKQALERDVLKRFRFDGIVTGDPALLRILDTVGNAARSDLPVLVQGPSGSGKELVVRALHVNSPRASRPFLTVNCAAISASLLESELFGHVRGAFTGALQDKVGIVPAADGGSLFLDEVGELPLELQGKLLRTIQFGEVQPVGSVRTRTVDVRFLAATNRDLEVEVKEGRFREDLFYRLNALTIALPALRERPGDVLPLFHHFLGRAAAAAGRPPPEVSPRLERALARYSWPGNVRDLENEARRLLALTPAGLPLTVDRLSPRILEASEPEPARAASLVEQEREHIELHLRLSGGNRSHAARSLGISREGLRRKMKRHGVS